MNSEGGNRSSESACELNKLAIGGYGNGEKGIYIMN
jgi:hypothetical protein